MISRTRGCRHAIIAATGLALVACGPAPTEENAAALDPAGRGIERIDLLADESKNATWFSVHPNISGLAVLAVHDEWNDHVLHAAELSRDGWLLGVRLPFSGTFTDRGARFMPDGRLLFSSRRPGSGGDWDLWQVSLVDGVWGTPTPLPSPVNTEHRDYHGSATKDGTIYFVSTRPGSIGEGDIYRAVPGGDGYRVERLPAGVNTALWEVDVFVSPDEDYLLFARTDAPDGLGGDDLFVALRDGDGWAPPRRIDPPVNSVAYDYGAALGPDADEVYFTSHRGGRAAIYRLGGEAFGLPPARVR